MPTQGPRRDAEWRAEKPLWGAPCRHQKIAFANRTWRMIESCTTGRQNLIAIGEMFSRTGRTEIKHQEATHVILKTPSTVKRARQRMMYEMRPSAGSVRRLCQDGSPKDPFALMGPFPGHKVPRPPPCQSEWLFSAQTVWPDENPLRELPNTWGDVSQGHP